MMRRMLWTGAVLLVGCGGGSVSVTAWGEDFIEQSIPAAEFEDGFTVTYSRFLAVVQEVSLRKKSGEVGPAQQGALVVDVRRPGPVELFAWSAVPVGKWDDVRFAIAPATSATGVGEVPAADVSRMTTGGLSLYLEGTVVKADVTKRFAWGFTGNTRYSGCRSEALGEGLTVPAGGAAEMQLTLHGDHPWYDALAGTRRLRAQAIVDADADGDGEVTLDELAAVPLTRLPAGQYDTTGAAGVKTLRDFVTTLTRTVGHFQGEGECEVESR
jgi:hypothetical protein